MLSTNGHAAVIDLPGRELTHAFAPRDEAKPWGLCSCGFAQSSHLEASEPYEPQGTYRCPACVSAEVPICAHRHPGELL
jgi:hypothetical protein